MSKPLAPGESRMIQGGRNRAVKVTAECVDADTPYLHISAAGRADFTLTDSEAKVLVSDLMQALRILPTSK